ncbi:MAG TPA: U32 family peptidase [Desulfuromonadaceae bacterium]
MKKPELLAPAGNMEKLKIAVHYGADAVYLGGKLFGLRNMAENFSLNEMAAALDYCHEHGVRAYLTINSYPHNETLEQLEQFLHQVASLPFDAYIVADAGVIDLVQEISPQRELHLSTQANTINWRSAGFWQRQGIQRVNLARETSLEAIAETVTRTGMEVEVFIHGALCISYSGRCLLSSAMAGRDANRGECAHPCRWNYRLVEESRPGQYFPVLEDDNGTFIFNSRDLCLLEHLPEIINTGATSLKIEGRMKGINYVASVLRVYRQALDEYCADPLNYRCNPEWLEELSKLSHRGYTTGFIFGEPRDVGQEYQSAYIRSHDFVGLVEKWEPAGNALIAVRNRIQLGDKLEFIGPGMRSRHVRVDQLQLINSAGETSTVHAANPNQQIILPLPFEVAPFDLVRRQKKDPP